MRIAQIAPPFESIPPTHYGGTERVVSLLTEDLVRRGHEVTLFASGDSTTSARLIPTIDTALWREPLVGDALMYWTITLGEAYRRAAHGEFDIIHAHVDFLSFPCAELVTTPTVTTLHGRLDVPGLRSVFARFPDQAVISISNNQRAPLPDARWLSTVYNAVDIGALPFHDEPGEYLAFLGRISADKGLEQAIHIARRAGLPLRIAARKPLLGVDSPQVRADWDYYRTVIRPLLREPGVEFIGEVRDSEKAEFLGNARALLFPIDWPEPFGLVMAESLACGTPVIARRRGSVPEVVEHGVTGWIGESDEDLAHACGHLEAFDRATCRAIAEQRFGPAEMTDGYVQAYHRLLSSDSYQPRTLAVAT
jgi:glycosyltransferase involved in cell wall biosynthesis